MRQRLVLHGAVSDVTLPTPALRVDDDKGVWELDAPPGDIDDEDELAEGQWGENEPLFTEETSLAEMMAIDPEVEDEPIHTDLLPGGSTQ